MNKEQMIPQGTPVNRFTVSDIPMISQHATKRWDVISDDVKRDIGNLIRSTLKNPEASLSAKHKSAQLAVTIDKLNLAHEKMYTPKASVDVSNMSLEEIQSELDMLQKQEAFETVFSLLYESTEAEVLEETTPIAECLEYPEVVILDKYVPKEKTSSGDVAYHYEKNKAAGRIV